jgi:hypothetical protein
VTSHVYAHPEGKGLGEHHAGEHGRELPAEMRDLDLPPGTEADHIATDEDTGAVILAWTDRTGTPRNSAVSPEFFAAHFTEGEAV